MVKPLGSPPSDVRFNASLPTFLKVSGFWTASPGRVEPKFSVPPSVEFVAPDHTSISGPATGGTCRTRSTRTASAMTPAAGTVSVSWTTSPCVLSDVIS